MSTVQETTSGRIVLHVYQQFESDKVLRVLSHTPFIRPGDSITGSEWDSNTNQVAITDQAISSDGTMTQAMIQAPHRDGGHLIANRITTAQGEVKTAHILVGGIKDFVDFVIE